MGLKEKEIEVLKALKGYKTIITDPNIVPDPSASNIHLTDLETLKSLESQEYIKVERGWQEDVIIIVSLYPTSPH